MSINLLEAEGAEGAANHQDSLLAQFEPKVLWSNGNFQQVGMGRMPKSDSGQKSASAKCCRIPYKHQIPIIPGFPTNNL